MGELTTQLDERSARKLCDRIVRQAEDLRGLLLQLRDGKGWIALGHASWAECCEKEFGYTKQHANYLIRTDAVRHQVEEISSTPLTNSQVDALSKVPEEKREAVLDWAAEKAGDKPLTAAAIRKAAAEVLEAESDDDEDDTDDSPEEAAWMSETSADDESEPEEAVDEPSNSVAPMTFGESVEADVRKWMEWYSTTPDVAAAVLENLAVKIRG
jgi:hypothetical protein